MSPSHRHSLGIARREFLQVGFSGLLGLGLPGLLAARAQAGAGSGRAPRAQSLILVFLSGGLSHLDSFDMKPDAPEGIRGEFKPIDTSVPGVRICEHLPGLAQRADQLAVVRSMSHPQTNHLNATHQILTGQSQPGAFFDKIASRDDYPCYAAALDAIRPRERRHPRRGHAADVPDGRAARLARPARRVPRPAARPLADPAGPEPARFPGFGAVPARRLQRRAARTAAELARRNRGRRRRLAGEGRGPIAIDVAVIAEGDADPIARQRAQAYSLLLSGKVARAFDLNREDPRIRDRYGRHMFGQSLLLARRLIQAGVPIVQVNMGRVQIWDTHSGNFKSLKDRLLPPTDQGISALLDDLAATGLLDETLVIVTGEFGRTPRIGTTTGNVNGPDGRDHWSKVFSSVFAGAGVRGGQAIGQSDRNGAYPASRPYTPGDFAATIYRALGVDPETELRDQLGRPIRLCNGTPIEPLFSA